MLAHPFDSGALVGQLMKGWPPAKYDQEERHGSFLRCSWKILVRGWRPPVAE
ncbi:hypothetical protein MPTK1_8g11225 [Marchantia polymorpha subsp. ruderalis]